MSPSPICITTPNAIWFRVGEVTLIFVRNQSRFLYWEPKCRQMELVSWAPFDLRVLVPINSFTYLTDHKHGSNVKAVKLTVILKLFYLTFIAFCVAHREKYIRFHNRPLYRGRLVTYRYHLNARYLLKTFSSRDIFEKFS